MITLIRMGTDSVFGQWLWDLIPTRRKPPRAAPAKPTPAKKTPTAQQQRYDQIVKQMKQQYGIRIHRWRKATTGCAWQVMYHNGTVARLIESPYPRGPVSMVVFLHEVGHHVIGFHTYKPRCLEEYMAWQFALDKMHEHGLNVTPRVEKRFHDSMRYAVAKAKRRGIKRIPEELIPYAA